jgi:hypothetical protein
MSAFYPRLGTARAVRAGFAFFLSGISALSVGGCASSNRAYSADAISARVAEGPSIPMESDGLPVQASPSAQIRQMPDDPSQPYSPNYGGFNPASKLPGGPTVKASIEASPARPAIPEDLPPSFRRQLVATTVGAG